MLEDIMQTCETMGSTKQMQVLKLQPDLHPAARPAPRAYWKMELLRSKTMQGEQIRNSLDGGVPSSFSLKNNTGFNTSGNSKKVSTSPLANKK